MKYTKAEMNWVLYVDDSPNAEVLPAIVRLTHGKFFELQKALENVKLLMMYD